MRQELSPPCFEPPLPVMIIHLDRPEVTVHSCLNLIVFQSMSRDCDTLFRAPVVASERKNPLKNLCCIVPCFSTVRTSEYT